MPLQDSIQTKCKHQCKKTVYPFKAEVLADVTIQKEPKFSKSIKRKKQFKNSIIIQSSSLKLERIKSNFVKSHQKQNTTLNQNLTEISKNYHQKKAFSSKNLIQNVPRNCEQVLKCQPINSILCFEAKINHQNKTQKSKDYSIKKRVIRKTTSFLKVQNNKKMNQKEQSFTRQPTLYQKALENQRKQQSKLNNSEKYYISDLKKQFKRLVNSQEQFFSNIVHHFMQSVTTFHAYKNIIPPENPHLKVTLPSNKSKDITLIFDMDQTLLHAQNYDQFIHDQNQECWGQNMDINFDDKSTIKINLKIRPFAQEVLKRLKQKFQIGLFTAGNQIYARQVLKKLDYKQELFDFLLFRQHCHTQNQKLSIKDLRILSNRELKKIVLIDNSPHTYLYCCQNAIPITSFYDDQFDTQLLKLEVFLQNLHKKPDIPHFLERYFKISKYKHYLNAQQLIEQLYGQNQ